MAVSYKKLWKLLIDRDMKKKGTRSRSTYTPLSDVQTFK